MNNGRSRAEEKNHSRVIRFPLSVQILVCLLLNVALAAGLFGWLLRSHFGVSEDWLLNEPVRERLQAMTGVLVAELREAPPEHWNDIIRKAGEMHQVELALYEKSGNLVAGCNLVLQQEVEDRLRLYDRHKSSASRTTWGSRTDKDGEENQEVFKPFSFLTEEQHSELKRLHRDHVEWVNRIFSDTEEDRHFIDNDKSSLDKDDEKKRQFIHDALTRTRSDRYTGLNYPKEAIRTSKPEGYWFLVRLPYVYPSWLVLVGKTETLGDTGLLFNPRPWLLAAVTVLIGSIVLWSPFIRYLTRSISSITGAAGAIADGRFDTKVAEHQRDELGVLGTAINQMGERLDGHLSSQKRFLGDVAHELCSPLARMELGMSILEQQVAELDATRLIEVRQELSHIQALVNELLTFTRTGLEIPTEPLEAVTLLPLLEAVIRQEASGREINLRVDADLQAMALPAPLQRALGNIIRNAVQQSPAATAIGISAKTDGESVHLAIADRGPGVAPESLPRIFEPFFREDTSRNRDTGGVGLGMAIVKNCLQSCSGEVVARNREGGGFVVEVTLAAVARS